MSRRTSNEIADNVCVVCCRNVSIFAVGECDHPVCHECSTRMRVICAQNECPICRTDMQKVIFSQTCRRFVNQEDTDFVSIDKKYKIYFVDETCLIAFEKLLEHRCKACHSRTSFRSFGALKDHLRRDHELYFCDICVDNLKIFTHERKFYTRSDLARHRRTGDPDNRSHRGHPLCEYCDERFLDNDELFRHLRREHFFCHFCDADGIHHYYRNYEELRFHFRKEHYLCEEGLCKDEQFTCAFRTDIDLKAHKVSVHSNLLSKAQAKQARTLEVEFTIAPRSQNNGQAIDFEEQDGRKGKRPNRNRNRNDRDEMQGATGGFDPLDLFPSASIILPDTNCHKEFPTLSGDGRQSSFDPFVVKSKYAVRAGGLNSWYSQEAFPALGNEAPVLQQMPTRPASMVVSSVPPQPQPKKKNSVTLHLNNKNDFPTLGGEAGGSKGGKTNLSIQFSQALTASKEPEPPANVNKNKDATTTTKWKVNKLSSRQNITLKKPSASSEKNQKQKINLASVNGKLTITTSDDVKKTSHVTIPVNEPSVKKEEPKVTKRKKQNTVAAELLKSLGKSTDQSVKSELNVGGLKKGMAAMQLNDDFPSLTSTSKQKNIKVPPGFSVSSHPPPPGFDSGASGNNKMPPGFNVTLNSVARQPQWFNNESGLNLTVSSVARNNVNGNHIFNASPPALPYSYAHPDNFDERNQVLVQTVCRILNNDETKFAKFRSLSVKFRNDKMDASAYYQECINLMGKERFLELFPELLVLLPDIQKQQQLLTIHRGKGVKNGQSWTQFLVCATCQQAVAGKDFVAHKRIHDSGSSASFNNLGSGSSNYASWVK